MRPVSEAFLNAVRGSHGMAARARICDSYNEGVNPPGVFIPILSGDVQLNSTSNVRSTLDMTTDGSEWQGAKDARLTPYGNEVFVERGVKLGNSSVEWVSLGYFKIYATEQEDNVTNPVRITASDRMQAVIDARLTGPVQFNHSSNVQAVFETLIHDVYPDATVEFDYDASNDTLGRTVIAGGTDADDNDRYAFLNDMVTSRGKVWYWDYRGVLVIKDPPSPSQPVVEINAGEDGVLVSASRSLSRESVYNAVVATGEATDDTPPVTALAVDSDPNSKTYYYGTFGKVPQFYSSPLLTTLAQARSAASSLLVRSLGLPYVVDFSAVPNPALEPYDPVRLRLAANQGRETHVLDTLGISLVYDAMTATGRKQTASGVGIVDPLAEEGS